VLITSLTSQVQPLCAQSFWVNPGVGDFNDPANWTAGVPGFNDLAIIGNGGTAEQYVPAGADLGTRQFRVGGGTASTMRLVVDGEYTSNLLLGNGSGTHGEFFLSGAGVADLRGVDVGYQGTGYLELAGVSLTGYELNVRTGSRLNHVSGSYHLDSGFDLYGTYEIASSASLDVYDMTVANGGQVLQHGGAVQVDHIWIRHAGTAYRQYGGTYEAAWRTRTTDGIYELHGGTATPGGLDVSGGMSVYGGTLNLNRQIYNGDRLSLENGPWTVNIQDSIVDFSRDGLPNSFIDLSAGTLTSTYNSLTILPASLDTTRFLNYTPAGLVHTPGQTLVIPADREIRGDRVNLSDHVVVEGKLSARTWDDSDPDWDFNIGLNQGVDVRPGASVKLGHGGVRVNNTISRMDGQTLTLERLGVGDISPGRFVHASGLIEKDSSVSDGMDVRVGGGSGADGVYEIHPGATLRAESLWVGVLGGGGHFIQHGGDVVMSYSSGAHVSIGHDGLYELNEGTLNTQDTYLGGDSSQGVSRFIQRGGYHESDDMWVGYGNGGSEGHYLLQGGIHKMFDLDLAGLNESVGRYVIDGGHMRVEREAIFGGGGAATFELNSGSMSVGYAETRAYSIGRVDLLIAGGEADFDTLLLGGYTPSSNTIRKSDGPVTVGLRQSAEVLIKHRLVLIGDAQLDVEPGSRIDFVNESGARFELQTDNEAAFAGLNDLTLAFADGLTAAHELEVGGEDLGTLLAGLNMNFALDSLVVGDTSPGALKLVDTYDNQTDGLLGDEALYVRCLEVGPGSVLDLNGLNLYYDCIDLDPTAVVYLNGGTLLAAPEPSSAGLLCLGLWGVLQRGVRPARSRRRSG